ncbi:unnamed protein product [Ectocarpus sp. CCAP 1310/34]|nr:unnamed protein product [Ectocarpus sp. CCAP 1310/34]
MKLSSSKRVESMLKASERENRNAGNDSLLLLLLLHLLRRRRRSARGRTQLSPTLYNSIGSCWRD